LAIEKETLSASPRSSEFNLASDTATIKIKRIQVLGGGGVIVTQRTFSYLLGLHRLRGTATSNFNQRIRKKGQESIADQRYLLMFTE
jgi:hypothetical protein